MILEIKKKFLIFPVNTLSTNKKLSFKKAEKTEYQLNIKLDNVNPNFYAYIDMSRFIGEKMDVSVEPEMKLVFQEADEMDIENLYDEPMRPQIHFTTKNGWINDPNGLIYLDGVYHMFYQYNPAEPNWENMHWGHAESPDLIHWEEKSTALFPDERGTMFSGSAALDDKNLLGKSDGNSKTAMLFYTTTDPFCQNMSYSTDNFKTIVRYADNPVVPHIKVSNRDPKVIFCDELDCYIMIIYLDEEFYCILKSDNLTDWTELQRIQLIGDSECPDIFPLNDSEGNRKWVIIGAHDKYLVGNFETGKFVAEQSVLTLHYGTSGYAGQSFSNLPGGRIVRVVWDRWNLPVTNFNGQMGIPMELALCKFKDVYYLEANPVKELEKIYKNTQCYENIDLASGGEFTVPLEDAAHVFKIRSKNFCSGVLKIEIFGRTVCLDHAKNEIKIGNCVSPLSLTNSDLDLTVVVDRCSMELFTDGGKIFISCLDNDSLSDRNIPYLTVKADSAVTLEKIEIDSLNSIWNK